MRVVFMGTPAFAARVLETLLESGHTVCAVVTQPDRPKGRSKKLVPSPVKQIAISAEVPVLQPDRASDPEFVGRLSELAPDVIAVAAYGEILKKTVLDVPNRACVNVHASLLPAYRGASPVPAAIAAGETVTGLTVQLMDEGMDTGDILLQRRIDIKPDETAGELLDRMAPTGGAMLVETLNGLATGTISPVPQNNDEATYCSLIRKSDGEINWSRTVQDIHNHVRAMNPWPVAFTDLHGRRIRVWRTRIGSSADLENVSPGTIVRVEKDRIDVAAGSGGTISLIEVQAAGGRPMDAYSFAIGHRLAKGDRFGTETDGRTTESGR